MSFKEFLSESNIQSLKEKFIELAKKTPLEKNTKGYIETARNDYFLSDYRKNINELRSLFLRIYQEDKEIAEALWKEYRDEISPSIEHEKRKRDFTEYKNKEAQKAQEAEIELKKIEVDWRGLTSIFKEVTPNSIQAFDKAVDNYIDAMYYINTVRDELKYELFDKYVFKPFHKEYNMKHENNKMFYVMQDMKNLMSNTVKFTDKYMKNKTEENLNQIKQVIDSRK